MKYTSRLGVSGVSRPLLKVVFFLFSKELFTQRTSAFFMPFAFSWREVLQIPNLNTLVCFSFNFPFFGKLVKFTNKGWTNPFPFFEKLVKFTKKDGLTTFHFFQNFAKFTKKDGLTPFYFLKNLPKL